MSLIIEITQQNGLVVRQPVDPNSAKIAAQPGDKIRILNAETGQPAGDLVARRVGDALVVEQAGGATVLSFTGEGGASLGSVTLLGVNAADYESVGSLFDPATGILQATGDGFHANLGVV